jgi:hypothetical protein
MQEHLKEVVMLHKPIVVLAVALVLGTSGLSTSAFARGNHVGEGFGDTDGHRHGAYDNRTSSLRGGFRGYENRDAWGHWGAYYGPMI